VTLIISASDLARFFEQTGRPIDKVGDRPGPPTPAQVEHLVALAHERGYWLASPDENAEVELALPAPPG
jgi:hypothetical protein